MLEDSAGTVDTKFGKQYGDYARSAASTVAGLASTLDQKDLDELAGTTRDFVKKSPAVAVGAAAVIGFVLARMLKGGSNERSEEHKSELKSLMRSSYAVFCLKQKIHI